MKKLCRVLIVSCGTLGAAFLILLLILLLWKPPLLDDVSFSRAVFDRNGELLRLTISKDQKYRLFTPLKNISPSLREAVLLHEDKYFYKHIGVNPVALVRAFNQSYFSNGRKIGASTITMQLARIKYDINSRNVSGKLWQITKALQLEMHYTKDELFEAYLNLAPYGYNIEGAGAASFIYFRQKPAELTLPEALTLAVIPQSPYNRKPEHENPAKPQLISARNRLFDSWLEEHPQAVNQKPFFSLPLATYSIADLPFRAPHFVNNLLTKYKTSGQITSTINLDTQLLLENILQKYVIDRRELGINNASAMLIDTQNMQVIASIGSADFFNKSISGQVDGTRAHRSPGSALKPFIYALAFDQGLIHPLSILGDAPTSFGSYAPDNFDRDFRGPIAARDALRLSRNVPAIKLAAKLHSPDLYQFFQNAGISKLHDKKDYGLTLVLGGAEVTMRELAELYAMLANNGIEKPLQLRLINDDLPPAKKLLSAEASFMTLNILKDTPRPPSSTGSSDVYWKTGTSNGFHDAWTAGVFGHYVLVVWVGNFNGKNNPSLVGVLSAAPLFFAMADAVAAKEPQHDLIADKADKLNLRKINICATTGDIDIKACPSVASTWFIPGVSPIQSHDVYRQVLVNLQTGKRACIYEAGKTEYRTYEVWPSDLQQTLQKAGIHKIQLPPRDENCAAPLEVFGQKPVITSPQATIVYHARIDSNGDAIPLNATSDGDVQNLHWFIGNRYFGKSAPGEPLLWRPQPGRYQVRVVDDAGRAATVSMLVEPAQ